MKKSASLICVLLAAVACTSHIQEARKAAADLEGSAEVGMSYVEFGQKLQALGGAIALARREGASESALRPYVAALEMYNESEELWKLKIDCPAEFMESGTDCTGILGKIAELASKYGVPYDGEKLNQAWIAKAIKVPMEQRPGYPTYDIRSANREVFAKLLSTIWAKAEKTSKER